MDLEAGDWVSPKHIPEHDGALRQQGVRLTDGVHPLFFSITLIE